MLSLTFKTRRVVIKLGTGILTSGIGRLNDERIADICRQVYLLRQKNILVTIVSSGAVGLGMGKLGLTTRPTEVARLQAAAAIGQSILIQTWQKHFETYGITVGQLLLTRDDLRSRKRHLNTRTTFERLLEDGIVPIVNENDSVSAEEIEIKFGDNDILSASVASLIRADYLVILSTAPGLIDMKGTGKVIPIVRKVDANIRKLAGGTTSATAVGGMVTKLEAARIGNRSGCGVFIASGTEPDVIHKIFSSYNPGTYFLPSGAPLEAKKRWLAFFQTGRGTIRVDAGAAEALVKNGKSLLAKGVISCEGTFRAGDIVNIVGPTKTLIGRGVTQFSSGEITQIRRKYSSEIRKILPDHKRQEIVHRDSLVLLG